MNIRMFLRMAHLARHPPSMKKIKLVAAILGVIAVLYGIELVFGWPEWLVPSNNLNRLRP